MKRWRTPIDGERPVPLWLATGLLQGVGTQALAQSFLATMQRAMAANHCTIFLLDERGRASVVSAASSYGDAAAETAHAYIRQGFDRQDSNMVWLSHRKTPRRPQAWISHQRAEEVGDPAYRRLCYGENSIRERVSLLLLLADGQRVAVSFYRGLASDAFQPADLDWVAACAPLLMAAVMAHLRRIEPGARSTPLRERLLAPLPHRERQVMAGVLDGRTTTAIAESLRLSPNTVLTYRYRAFAKLGIRTLRELLARVDAGTATAPAGRTERACQR